MIWIPSSNNWWKNNTQVASSWKYATCVYIHIPLQYGARFENTAPRLSRRYFSRVNPRYIPSTLFANPAIVVRVELLTAEPAEETILEMKSRSLSALNEICRLVKPTLQFILKEVYLPNLLEEDSFPSLPLDRLMVRSLPATLHWKGIFFAL